MTLSLVLHIRLTELRVYLLQGFLDDVYIGSHEFPFGGVSAFIGGRLILTETYQQRHRLFITALAMESIQPARSTTQFDDITKRGSKSHRRKRELAANEAELEGLTSTLP